jgi:hypothetical protein
LTQNNATIWFANTMTGFSYTGTSNVEANYSGAVGARATTFGNTAGATESNVLNFYVTAGTDTISMNGSVKTLDFTGHVGAFILPINIYGDLKLANGSTGNSTATAVNFLATSGVQQITTANVTIDRPLTFNGIGGTFAFQDALTQGSTRNFTITNGTVQLKNGVTSTVGNFLTSGTNQKFLRSTLTGSQATLSQASGTVNASYLTIQDINATGGATWNAYVNQFNSDAGNVDGWDFGISPVVGGAEYTYSMRSFTQPRRF